ncbi:tetratricopeptide repeat protein [Pseudohongiella sp. SYSU M77423]|uniref:tetratricopeptide repeat protein n=1 Tax=Pseudohongiella sp. SYSU M77423 TaxID=3042312 RepID=UPI0024804165|nr:tetratricopeptide repeat protein [Pseudohongiella sp. SYSU M77423]MDH7943345.1 tetratricopeptide repeat protein [Pseudohongiella sp. SYSU M77423]
MSLRSGLLIGTLLLAACASPQRQTPAPVERSQPSLTGTTAAGSISEPPGPVRSGTDQADAQGGFVGPTSPAPPDARATPTSTLMAGINSAVDAGELERAAAIAERGLRIDPRDASIWLSLANVRLLQNRPAEATALAQRAMSEAGNDTGLRREIQAFLDRVTDDRR